MVQDELAANITEEQGKTLADAKGDVFRGLGEWGRPAPAFTSVMGCMARCMAKSSAGSPLRHKMSACCESRQVSMAARQRARPLAVLAVFDMHTHWVQAIPTKSAG